MELVGVEVGVLVELLEVTRQAIRVVAAIKLAVLMLCVVFLQVFKDFLGLVKYGASPLNILDKFFLLVSKVDLWRLDHLLHELVKQYLYLFVELFLLLRLFAELS